MALSMILGIQSCIDDPKPTINSNDFDFQAVNITVENGKLSATSGSPATVNWTVNVTINGETTSISGSTKSDELPVRVGDEIEIEFSPACPEQTEAYFTMPDGISHKVTVNDPKFKWTIPNNFSTGMQIIGKTLYETNDRIYNKTGTITLIAL